MKLSPVPQNIPEWLALKSDLVPVPLAHTHICFVLSRAVLEAFSQNVFEAFNEKPLSLIQASEKTQLNKRALNSLLNVLLSAGYFKYSNGNYSLTKHSRKWCLKESKHSLYNQQMFNLICWDWMNHMPEFLKTGKGLQYHDTFNEAEWELYQKGMESVAANTSTTSVKIAPRLTNPVSMLDIGGSHGLYSAAFCNKYPSLKSTILDLPQAVDKAEPLLRAKYKGNNIQYRKGNALSDDFGNDEHDIVLMSSLMHHFSEEQNLSVSKTISKSLKKGGYFIIQEFIRPEPSSNMDMLGATLDLFFNLSSTSGNWSIDELIAFQKKSGLTHVRTNRFMMLPGFVQVIGRKNQESRTKNQESRTKNQDKRLKTKKSYKIWLRQ